MLLNDRTEEPVPSASRVLPQHCNDNNGYNNNNQTHNHLSSPSSATILPSIVSRGFVSPTSGSVAPAASTGTSMIDSVMMNGNDQSRPSSSPANNSDDPYLYMPTKRFSSIDECERAVLDWNETRSKVPTAPFIKKPWGSSLMPCGPTGPMYPRFTPCSHSIVMPLIIVPVVIFCTSTVDHDEWWSKIVAIVLLLVDLAILHAGSMVDPGVMLPLRVGDEPPANNQVVSIDGIGEVKLETCRTCKILRAPRSSHCGISGACILQYDHMCGVTSHVVAAKTFKFFVGFMYVTSVLSVFVVGRSIAAATTWNTSEMSKTSLGTWYLVSTCLNIAFIGLSLCWVSGVGCHYTDLTCTGETLKDRRGRRAYYHQDEAGWSCGRWFRAMFTANGPESSLRPEMAWVDDSGRTQSYV